MTHETLSNSLEIKNYFDRRFGKEDPLLHAIRTEAEKKGLPPIQVSIHLGRLLFMFAKIQGARRILEIGILGGYSTICLARALPPEGYLLAFEKNALHVEIAKEHIEQAGLSKNVEIRQGLAIDLLAEAAASSPPPFDFIFIDADKEGNALYLEWAIHLSRPGTLILIDNMIPKGDKVGYPSHHEAEEVYAFNDYLALHPLLESAIFPTLIGETGRLDGVAILLVKEFS
ncbi:MAG: O-methyltransferase [Candidatus Protochlamydia sp.]|nr:O-methyltransferase [Candidatus Protochlamydia sp.]